MSFFIFLGLVALGAAVTMLACLCAGAKEDAKQEKMYENWKKERNLP